jgi:hypothetical protein
MTTSPARRFAGLIAATALAATATLTLASPPARAAAPEQAGSVAVGANLGVNFLLSDGSGSAANLGFSLSYAFADQVYFVFQPSFSFFSGATIINLPIGLQFDVAVAKVPGLYLYPRVSVGAAFLSGGGGANALLMLDGGLKYNVNETVFVGFEPLSLPIYIGDGGGLTYKISIFGGIYF